MFTAGSILFGCPALNEPPDIEYVIKTKKRRISTWIEEMINSHLNGVKQNKEATSQEGRWSNEHGGVNYSKYNHNWATFNENNKNEYLFAISTINWISSSSLVVKAWFSYVGIGGLEPNNLGDW